MERKGERGLATILHYDWFTLILIGLGVLFLFGEILVNMRGFFALIGIFLISYYFYLYVNDGSTFIMMFIIFIVGLFLIIIDGKFIGDGTLGIVGLLGMMTPIVITAPSFVAGLYAVIGFIVGLGLSFLFLKLFKRRNMWDKLMLKDRLTEEAGYSSVNKEFVDLIGKKGSTVTDLRPSGTAKIESKTYSVISDGHWIRRHTNIKVVNVDGTKILVAESEETKD